jgi:hypothetical protein
MIIYDVIRADEVENGDQVYVNLDPLENVGVDNSGSLVVIKGYSHNTGDVETYCLVPDAPVELWMV